MYNIFQRAEKVSRKQFWTFNLFVSLRSLSSHIAALLLHQLPLFPPIFLTFSRTIAHNKHTHLGPSAGIYRNLQVRFFKEIRERKNPNGKDKQSIPILQQYTLDFTWDSNYTGLGCTLRTCILPCNHLLCLITQSPMWHMTTSPGLSELDLTV